MNQNACPHHAGSFLRPCPPGQPAINNNGKHTALFNPRSPKKLWLRCHRNLAKGDLDGALADYNHAIELDPKNAVAYDDRGLLKQNKGDNDGALADYNKA